MGKKILACFGENLGGQEAFQSFAERLEQEGFEVHLFDRVVAMELKPHNVFTVMEHVWKERLDENEYYFLTDIKDYFKLAYRLFQQTFAGFIFWSGESCVYDVDLEGIYARLLHCEVLPEERLYKRIYTNDLAYDFGSGFMNSQKVDLADFPVKWEEVPLPVQQTVYRFSGECYLIEPASGKAVYINLDSEQVADDVRYCDIIMPCEVDKESVRQVEDMLEMVAVDYETCLRRQDIMHKVFSLLRGNIMAAGRVEQKYYCALLEVMGEGYGAYAEIASLSLLLQMYRESRFYRKILGVCLAGGQLTALNKYFILMQCKYVELFDRMANAEDLLRDETALFNQITDELGTALAGEVTEITGELNKNRIVIMTSQFLSYEQALTGYALEMAVCLMEKLGKQVWIINTCEFLTQNARVPFFDASASTIMGEYSNSNNVEFDDIHIPFYQMTSPMPDFGGIAGLLEFLQEIKPALIINIGELSAAAALCARQTPCLFLPHSGLKLFTPVGQAMVVDKDLPAGAREFYMKAGVKLLDAPESITAASWQKREVLEEILRQI